MLSVLIYNRRYNEGPHPYTWDDAKKLIGWNDKEEDAKRALKKP